MKCCNPPKQEKERVNDKNKIFSLVPYFIFHFPSKTKYIFCLEIQN